MLNGFYSENLKSQSEPVVSQQEEQYHKAFMLR